MDLSNIPTCELIKELIKREGVNTTCLNPYEDKVFIFSGPCTILEVIN